MPLLVSRLVVPAPPEVAIARPRLHTLVDQGVDGPVTLVSAPPGWGKTVLLASWARGAAREHRTAWLSVERGDDARFWSYLRASLSAATAGGHALPPAAGDDLAPLAQALMRLPEPVVLVLDDLQELRDPVVFAGLAFLVRHAAGRLRLVIAARNRPDLPLHRWRLSGELTELRAGQLAFTAAEAGELLTRHGVGLPQVRVEELCRRTEGWAAGLRLAALSARGHLDPATAADAFGGDDPRVEDYLRSEVLARQDPAVGEMLVRASVLEWLTPELVTTVTGRRDAARLLAALEREQALVFPVGSRPPTYRLHRPVAEFLRAELGRRAPEEVAELHRRAAGWLADHDRPAAALRHALAAGDRDAAVDVLTQHWPAFLLCPRVDTVGGAASASTPVAVPPRAGSDPGLALAAAAEQLDRRDPEAADRHLRAIRDPAAATYVAGDDPLALVAAGLRLASAQLRGDLPPVRAAADRLLAQAGQPSARGTTRLHPDQGACAVALTADGGAHLRSGELAAATTLLRRASATAARVGLTCPRLISTSQLAHAHAEQGHLVAAARVAEAAMNLPDCPRHGPVRHRAHAHLAAALVHLITDQLDEAGRHLALAAAGPDAAADPYLAAATGAVRVQLWCERGELDEAYRALSATRRDLAGRPVAPHLRDRLALLEAELHTAAGETRAASRLLATLPAGTPAHQAAVAVASARARLRDGDPAGAAPLVARQDQSAGVPLPVRVDARLLAALAARDLGDSRGSFRLLEEALELAGPEGVRRVFTGTGAPAGTREALAGQLDSGTAHWVLVKELISSSDPAGGPVRRVDPPPGGAELTDREVTVLRYLQGMLSTAEIAGELHLSVNTVKTHLRHVYRKLQATSRRDAVRRARALRVL